jgi:D-arabinose 1-dehydrogenase-like Zn-dependent alcohol dehydrogenase
MRSVQVSKANGAFEVVEKNILPEPKEEQVRIKVQACGIRHGDSITKQGLFPGIQYPRVPGHEVAGVIDDVGKECHQLEAWTTGCRRLAWRSLWSLFLL